MTVVYGPVTPPTTDWRYQEMLNLEPYQVMAELLQIDVNLCAARSELQAAKRQLGELETVFSAAKRVELEDTQQQLPDLFKGGTKDERAQRQATYLDTLKWVQQQAAEIKAAQACKDNAQVAFDSLTDRQANLGRFANMYAATTRLLASIRPPDLPARLPSAPDLEPELEIVSGDGTPNVWAIFQFAERARQEVMPPSLHALCADVRSWMEWHKTPVGSPPVDTAGLIARVVVAGVDKRKAVAEATALGRPVLEDEVLDALGTALGLGSVEIPDTSVQTDVGIGLPDDHDEGEYGQIKAVADAIVHAVRTDEVEIPASMKLSPDEAEAAAAAIKRHRGEGQSTGGKCPECGHDLVQSPIFGLFCLGCGPPQAASNPACAEAKEEEESFEPDGDISL